MTQRILIVLNGLVMTKRKKIEPKHCVYSKNISEGEQIEPDLCKSLGTKKKTRKKKEKKHTHTHR